MDRNHRLPAQRKGVSHTDIAALVELAGAVVLQRETQNELASLQVDQVDEILDRKSVV